MKSVLARLSRESAPVLFPSQQKQVCPLSLKYSMYTRNQSTTAMSGVFNDSFGFVSKRCNEESVTSITKVGSSAMNLLVAGSSSCFLEPPNKKKTRLRRLRNHAWQKL